MSSSAGSKNLQILCFITTVTEDFWQTATLQHTSFGSTEYRIIACFISRHRVLYRLRIHITAEYHITTENRCTVWFVPRYQVLSRLRIHITTEYHITTENRCIVWFVPRYRVLSRLRIHITTEYHITTENRCIVLFVPRYRVLSRLRSPSQISSLSLQPRTTVTGDFR